MTNKKLSLCFAVCLLLATTIALAKEFDVPHEFKAGDVVSAEVFNEIFAKIKTAKNIPIASDLVGVWDCTSYVQGSTPGTVSGWQNASAAALFKVLSGGSITFKNDGDGTFSLTTSAPNPLNSADDKTRTATFEILSGLFVYEQEAVPEAMTPVFTPRYYDIRPISETRFVLVNLAINPMLLACDKQIATPEKPKKLSITASGDKATLAWTDASDNETGFKILRKDKVSGTYSAVATADANATTYTDEVDAAGTYWYRVVATNASGDSVGSNVAKFIYAP